MAQTRTRKSTARARAASSRRADPPPVESRRREIAEHAIRLMEEKGFAAMSIQHIADALEFSKANFYHHIDSKERLLYEIFVDTLQHSFSRIQEIVGSDRSIPDQLRALIEFYVSLMTERRATMLVWFKERAHLTDAHQKEVGRLEHQVGATLDSFYTRGIAAGYFKRIDVAVARFAIFGMCFQLTKMPNPLERTSQAEIARQLQDLACTGLLASPPQP